MRFAIGIIGAVAVAMFITIVGNKVYAWPAFWMFEAGWFASYVYNLIMNLEQPAI